MAKLLGNTRVYGNAIIDGTLTVGNIAVVASQVYPNTPSTSYLTGGLTIGGQGGIGIGGNLQVQGNVFVYPGGNVIISNTSTSINTVSGALVVAGGAGIGGNINAGSLTIPGALNTLNGNLSVTGNISASSFGFAPANWATTSTFAAKGAYGGVLSMVNTGGLSDGFALALTGTPSSLTFYYGAAGGTASQVAYISSTGNLTVGTVGAISGAFHSVVGNITQTSSGGAVYINTTGNVLASTVNASQFASAFSPTTTSAALSLTGTPNNSTSAKTGVLAVGPNFTAQDKNIMASFVQGINDYTQIVVQNTNSGASASADFIVNNDNTSGLGTYGDFGINSSTFSGTGAFNLPGATYLYSQGGELVLGTQSTNSVVFVVGSATNANAMVISGAGVISTNGQFTSNGNILVTSTGNLVVANTAASTSTATGALVITGGAGIAGNVAIGGNINLTTAGVLGGGGNILVNGVAGAIGQVLTQTGAGVAWQSGGASNYVFSAGGGSNVIVTASNVNVSINTSNIASFGSSGLQIITATASTSTITGALQVAGGVGIAGNLNVGTVGTTSGVFHTVIGNITQSTSGGAVYINTSGNILATGGVFQTINAANITITGVTPSGSGGGLYVSTSANVIVNNAAPSTSTTTGAVVIVGGVGIAGNLQLQGNLFVYPGGNVRIANTSQATSSTSGALQVVGGISSSSGNIYDNKGDVRASPISSQAGATIATAADAGRTIYIATGGVTINASVFNAGDMVTIVNNSSSAQTITAGTSVTFRLAGTASTGNRTLAQYGMCTFLCVVGGATPTFHCSGAGLT